MDAFIVMQVVEAVALTDKESAAPATGRAEYCRSSAFNDRGRGRSPSALFSTSTACCQQWR